RYVMIAKRSCETPNLSNHRLTRILLWHSFDKIDDFVRSLEESTLVYGKPKPYVLFRSIYNLDSSWFADISSVYKKNRIVVRSCRVCTAKEQGCGYDND